MVAVLHFWALGLTLFGASQPLGSDKDNTLYAELRTAFNDVCAYLALGDFPERRRLATDGSPVLMDTPYGPIKERMDLQPRIGTARAWIRDIIRRDVAPPKDAEFRVYKQEYNPRLGRGSDWFNFDGYDTLTVSYTVGGDRVQISQVIWVLALTVEGPDTTCELTERVVRGLPERIRSLMAKYLIPQPQEELEFQPAKLHTRCITADGSLVRPTTTQSREGRGAESAKSTDGIAYALIGWWADGKRMGLLLFKVPPGPTGVAPGISPSFNRGWLLRRRAPDDYKRLAEEYRTSTMPAQKTE